MIGLMNVPCDSPAEFYAAAPRSKGSSLANSATMPTLTSRPMEKEQPSSNNNNKYSLQGAVGMGSKATRLSFISLLNRRNANEIGYLKDGRKVFNGQVVENASAPKLWEQLIVRSFVHKIEDEIQSPSEQLSAMEAEFPKLNLQRNEQSKSTFSLVSDDRVTSQCCKCSVDGKGGFSHSARRSVSITPISTAFLEAQEVAAEDWGMALRMRQSKSVSFDQCGRLRRIHEHKEKLKRMRINNGSSNNNDMAVCFEKGVSRV